MSLFKIFRSKDQQSANIAKERLQIIVAHERAARNTPDYLPAMQKDILEVIKRYIDIDTDQVNVSLDKANDCSILELNVTLPE
ncbi:cell division topological specificity factor MinE [Aestuariirhabdus sp. Z084]|uniref:cell division topological specificity factor MinE n=1 Tax=Aestuariirhabdus haliotis TaxID=2918751 RepID=UPI00201B44BB|nr:cell division topological specificity factor MinE [Aestuariirhabdus haliotis]MCL6417301.1 cell division topological specificity factor MinE [Aestuariirhabdus haliotis]MCL6421246.1 cell division topological specificity factor MinE [Aestuariirhabdus haliotis]